MKSLLDYELLTLRGIKQDIAGMSSVKCTPMKRCSLLVDGLPPGDDQSCIEKDHNFFPFFCDVIDELPYLSSR